MTYKSAVLTVDLTPQIADFLKKELKRREKWWRAQGLIGGFTFDMEWVEEAIDTIVRGGFMYPPQSRIEKVVVDGKFFPNISYKPPIKLEDYALSLKLRQLPDRRRRFKQRNRIRGPAEA